MDLVVPVIPCNTLFGERYAVAGTKFFDERSDQSEVKARIVQKYFYAWANVIMPTAKRLGQKIAYIDLYAGPGRYRDGAASTPLLVLERAIAMVATPQHTYQILTKRAERIEKLSEELPWPQNIWLGVSVESGDYLWRIDHLRRTKAQTKFLSLEPLLGPVDEIDLSGIDWAIAGGESGPGARPMLPKWVRTIRDRCTDAGVAFHFKQWGGVNKKKTGRILDGRTWDELPVGRLERGQDYYSAAV